MTTTETVVRPGQIWQDADRRNLGYVRTLLVESVDVRYAHCISVNPDTLSTWNVSRRTRILLNRMRPTSSGYRLVQDAP